MSIRRKISVSSITPDNIITYSIALMMGVMFFDHTNALANISYFVALAAWLFKWIREKKVLLEWDILGIILMLLLVNALLSSFFSYDVKYSFRELRSEIGKMVPFYFLILSNIRTDDALKTILKAVFLGALVMSIIGIVGYFTGLTLYREKTISLFANESYTSLGFYLLVTSCLLFGLIINETEKTKIPLYFFVVIIYFGCILATMTRAIWLGFFSAAAIALFFYRKTLVLILPVVILLLLLLLPSKFTNRFITIFDFQNYSRAGGVLSDRVQLWESAVNMIRDYPELGVGYGKRIFQKVYIKEGYILPQAWEKRPLPNAHNLYLDTAIQLGIPGLFIFLFLFAVFFNKAIIAYKCANVPFSKGIIFGCLLAVYELLQIGLTGTLLYDENGLYIIFLMAITMRYYKQKKQKFS
jgi:O-antigen ligase